MISYNEMEKGKLAEEIKKLQVKIDSYKEKKYNLNMARGKPCTQQLDISAELMNVLDNSEYYDENGFDLRNYGILDGIQGAKSLFAQILGVDSKNVIVAGSSSLNLMYDTLSRAMLFGVVGSNLPWAKQEKIKFLCPSPGYDRHFGVTMDLGIEMITVPMNEHGPDMDVVEKLVSEDETIKGIWCVPVYSNPDGITYSKETCTRLASMKTKANDFTIMWDNAYCVHHLTKEKESVPEIISLCNEYNNPNRVFVFASTSKVTWAGAGIACIASSDENIKYVKSHMNYQSIGPDKINQLRHVKYLKDLNGVHQLMEKHANIINPKFQKVFEVLHKELEEYNIAKWNEPRGGYFISLYVPTNTAKQVVSLCKECGVELTPAGATFPYGKDPLDNNIRIAPTFPPINELEIAIEILGTCIKLVTAQKILENK